MFSFIQKNQDVANYFCTVNESRDLQLSFISYCSSQNNPVRISRLLISVKLIKVLEVNEIN